MKTRAGPDTEVAAIRERIAELLGATEAASHSATARKKLERELRALIGDLEASLLRLDPISQPASIFDPSNPKVIGRFTALALLAQDRRPLSSVGRFYGSGVYAIYYRGDFELYRPLSGTETPIYVGKASPSLQSARTAAEQGERLAARLNDHRKNITRAISTLDIADFEARFLVVQSGWEGTAEGYLINLFRPIWNSETNILYGLGKHGDDPLIRANRRSPWDTLHPGRTWARDSIDDAKPIEQIKRELERHFTIHRPVVDRNELLEAFFRELQQH